MPSISIAVECSTICELLVNQPNAKTGIVKPQSCRKILGISAKIEYFKEDGCCQAKERRLFLVCIGAYDHAM
jgi:hypothetical protein